MFTILKCFRESCQVSSCTGLFPVWRILHIAAGTDFIGAVVYAWFWNGTLASHLSLYHLILSWLSQEACDRYREVMEEEFCGRVPVLDLSLLEKMMFIWLQSWIIRNLRKSMPANRHVTK